MGKARGRSAQKRIRELRARLKVFGFEMERHAPMNHHGYFRSHWRIAFRIEDKSAHTWALYTEEANLDGVARFLEFLEEHVEDGAVTLSALSGLPPYLRPRPVE